MRPRTPAELCDATGGRLLHEAAAGPIAGIAIDSRDDLAGRAFFAIRGERHDGHAFLADAAAAGAALLVVERGASAALPSDVSVVEVDDTRAALGRLARDDRRAWTDITVVAVTGTAGKTTTKRLIHAVLGTRLPGTAAPRSFNNDIGVPLTLLAARPEDRYVVVEVGTNAPGEIDALGGMIEPDIAVITLIGRGHLEGLGTPGGVLAEKTSLLRHLRPGGFAVLHADSVPPDRHPEDVEVTTFGTAEGADLRLTGYDAGHGRSKIELLDGASFELRLPGRHNAVNALAAIAVARRLGIPDDDTRRGLAGVEPADMRVRPMRIDGITVYNDAYNANPESMAASIDTFLELTRDDDHRTVVLGDMLELGEHGPGLHREIGRVLVDADRRTRIDHVILVGRLMSHAADVLDVASNDDRITRVPDVTDAAAAAIRHRFPADGAVLLKGSRGLRLERILASKGDVLQPAPGD